MNDNKKSICKVLLYKLELTKKLVSSIVSALLCLFSKSIDAY